MEKLPPPTVQVATPLAPSHQILEPPLQLIDGQSRLKHSWGHWPRRADGPPLGTPKASKPHWGFDIQLRNHGSTTQWDPSPPNSDFLHPLGGTCLPAHTLMGTPKHKQ